MSEDVSRWGTIKEAAEISGFHHVTIRRYINDGVLPARRIGVKLIRVDLDAVRALDRPFVPASTPEA